MVEYFIGGILIVIIIALIVKLNSSKKKYEELEETKTEDLRRFFKDNWIKEQERLEYEKRIWEDDLTRYQNEIKSRYTLDASKYEGEIKQLDIQLKEKEKRYAEVNQDLDLYKEGKIEEINNANEHYKEIQKLLIDEELTNYRKRWTNEINDDIAKINDQRTDMLKDIETIKSILEEERSKRAAINEEILRQRKVEEQQDFYRIQLPEIDKPDIEILRATAPRLQHPEAINKIIWSNYYQKPLAELRKRLLPNGDYSGIYKITRIKTNEIYIGQTTSIDKRFQDHVKSALGVGTLTSSQLHRTMSVDGPENFTFEILEKVEKDKLKEREAFYINFYDSKNYGLNTVRGQEK